MHWYQWIWFYPLLGSSSPSLSPLESIPTSVPWVSMDTKIRKVLQFFWHRAYFFLGHSVCLHLGSMLRLELSFRLVTTWGSSRWSWGEWVGSFKASAPVEWDYHRVSKQTNLVSPEPGRQATSTSRWDSNVSCVWQSIQPDVPILSFRSLSFPIQCPGYYPRNLVRLWIQLS